MDCLRNHGARSRSNVRSPREACANPSRTFFIEDRLPAQPLSGDERDAGRLDAFYSARGGWIVPPRAIASRSLRRLRLLRRPTCRQCTSSRHNAVGKDLLLRQSSPPPSVGRAWPTDVSLTGRKELCGVLASRPSCEVDWSVLRVCSPAQPPSRRHRLLRATASATCATTSTRRATTQVSRLPDATCCPPDFARRTSVGISSAGSVGVVAVLLHARAIGTRDAGSDPDLSRRRDGRRSVRSVSRGTPDGRLSEFDPSFHGDREGRHRR